MFHASHEQVAENLAESMMNLATSDVGVRVMLASVEEPDDDEDLEEASVVVHTVPAPTPNPTPASRLPPPPERSENSMSGCFCV